MKELLAIIRGLLEGLDIRRRWFAFVGFFLLLIVAIYLFEIWSGWNYYSNLQKQIGLLSQLQSLSEAGIGSNSDLSPIYHKLILELSNKQIPHFTFPSFRFDTSQSFWKFVSGGSFWFLFALSALFGALGDENKIAGTIILIIFGAIIGVIAIWIPTILNPWVNYLGFPILQILLLILISSKVKVSK